MQNLGEILKNRRIQLGLSLENVEEETKIRKYYIAALEENNYSQLPAKVYAIGFVKRYACLLELDEDEVVKEFKSQAYHEDPREKEEVTLIKNRKDILKVPIKNIITGVIFLAVFIWIGTYLTDYMVNRKVEKPPVSPPAAEKQNKSHNTAAKPENTTTKPPVKIDGINLKITGINNDCWISWAIDDEDRAQTTIKPGEVKTLQAQDKIALKLGNAGAVKIEYNGKDLGDLGKQGSVVSMEFPPPGNAELPNEVTGAASNTSFEDGSVD
ncbi:MAG: helix-turn-helix domain-containing protein [Ignavibacteriales bacterium]